MSRENGGVFGKPVSPDTVTATGFWSLNAIQREKIATTWPTDLNIAPALKLDFNETTTLDNRISFTRATNGTYFNSSGVLTTAGSGVARFDHRLEGGVWVNKGLLIEEQRTNLALRSEELDNAYWEKNQVTVTANQITAPDGTTTADAVFETTANNFHYIRISNTTINATSSPFTVSIFIKANGRTRGQLKLGYVTGSFQEVSLGFNLSTGAITFTFASAGGLVQGSSITDVGNGWYRITLTGYTGQNGVHALQVFMLNDSGQSSYTGEITKGLYLWGAQLEAGAFPTSYIATTTASVTRNADQASMTSTNFSDWYNATEGTTFWQGDVVGLKGTSTRIYSISDNTSNEYMQGNFSNSAGNGFTWAVFDGAVLQAVLNTPNPPVTPSVNTTYKHAAAYKVNDFAASRDGGTVSTDASGTLPTVNRLYLGLDEVGTGTGVLNGHIAKFYYWNTRLSNNFLRDYTKT